MAVLSERVKLGWMANAITQAARKSVTTNQSTPVATARFHTTQTIQNGELMKISEQAEQVKTVGRVPVTLGELYGPVPCALCAANAWMIWVTPGEKEMHSFVNIFQSRGIARCEKCGPPN